MWLVAFIYYVHGKTSEVVPAAAGSHPACWGACWGDHAAAARVEARSWPEGGATFRS